MRHLKLYEQYINEALKLSDAKKYIKPWYEAEVNKLHETVFEGKYRIYLPIEDDLTSTKVISPVESSVNDILSQHGYEIVDYKKGMAKKGAREFKIGKLLNKLDKDILKRFNEDKTRDFTRVKKESELGVVISRHPYDIAGMSTDRGWSSCMSIETGSNKNYVMADVLEGTMVAYLVKSSDKNIKSPMARVLIKPFVHDYSEDVIYLVEERVYGTNAKTFVPTVKKWLDSWQNIDPGVYRLNKCLYQDSSGVAVINNKGDRDYYGLVEYAIKSIQDLLDSYSTSSKQIDSYSLCEDILSVIRDLDDDGDTLELDHKFTLTVENGISLDYTSEESQMYENLLKYHGIWIEIVDVSGDVDIDIDYYYNIDIYSTITFLGNGLRHANININIDMEESQFEFDELMKNVGLEDLVSGYRYVELDKSLTINLVNGYFREPELTPEIVIDKLNIQPLKNFELSIHVNLDDLDMDDSDYLSDIAKYIQTKNNNYAWVWLNEYKLIEDYRIVV